MTQDHDNLQELDAASEARVTEALNALEDIEPPAAFVSQVMWRTRQASTRNNQTRQTSRTGVRMISAKTGVMGVIGIAAAGLLVAYVGGFPPASHTEGTIGAAQRYQAPQVSASDVKVGDPALQAFMQTAIFDKLIHDKKAMAALNTPEVQAALSNAELAQALASSELQAALASDAFQQALGGHQRNLQAAIASPEFQQALGKHVSSLQAAIASPEFQAAIASPEFQAAIASPAFQQALQSSAFSQGLNASFFQGLQSQALASSDFRSREQ